MESLSIYQSPARQAVEQIPPCESPHIDELFPLNFVAMNFPVDELQRTQNHRISAYKRRCRKGVGGGG